MEVGLEDPLDAEAVRRGFVEVHLHVARGIHHHRLALVADQVRGMGETPDIELPEVHGRGPERIYPPPPAAAIPFPVWSCSMIWVRTSRGGRTCSSGSVASGASAMRSSSS